VDLAGVDRQVHTMEYLLIADGDVEILYF